MKGKFLLVGPKLNRLFRLDWGSFRQELSFSEISGAFGDLGTFLPLLLALSDVDAVESSPALLWAGVFNVLTGMLWDSPMPVQPMKTISAVAITEGLTAIEVVGAGLGVGIVITILGITGGVDIVNWLVPISVVRGLQLGLGLSMMSRGIEYISNLGSFIGQADCIFLGLVGIIFTLFATRYRNGTAIPSALILTVVGVIIASIEVSREDSFNFQPGFPVLWIGGSVTWDAMWSGFVKAGLPQIPLTTLNSVVSVCELNSNLFPKNHISRKSVATSVGLMNLSGLWFGAMPMCHGAGGLAAQYKFGARGGASVVCLGAVKILLACLLAFGASTLLEQFPSSILGILLVFAGLGLANNGAKPRDGDSGDDYMIMIATAGFTLTMNTGWGCVAGLIVAGFHGGFDHVGEAIRRKFKVQDKPDMEENLPGDDAKVEDISHT